jgi:hypothetical protein
MKKALTFRTALALLAGAVTLLTVDPPTPPINVLSGKVIR